jgi:P4 family phage/plasmid primase-like protien
MAAAPCLVDIPPAAERAAETERFISEFYADRYMPFAVDAYLFVLPDRTAHRFRLAESAAEFAREQADLGRSVYFHTSLHQPGRDCFERGRADNCIGAIGLWSDIDAVGPGRGKPAGTLCPSVAAAEDLVAEFEAMYAPLRIGALIRSGHCVYPAVLFRERYDVEGPGDRDRLEKLGRRYREAIHRLACGRGWPGAADSCDLAKVLRLPGTVNPKDPSNPKYVHVARRDDEARYNPADLEDILPELERRTLVSGVALDPVDPVIEIDRTAYAPPILYELRQLDPRVNATWELRRADLRDQSWSGYAMSLANTLVRAPGVTDQQIADTLISLRRRMISAGMPVKERTNKELAYCIGYTLRKARAWAASQDDALELELDAEGAASELDAAAEDEGAALDQRQPQPGLESGCAGQDGGDDVGGDPDRDRRDAENDGDGQPSADPDPGEKAVPHAQDAPQAVDPAEGGAPSPEPQSAARRAAVAPEPAPAPGSPHAARAAGAAANGSAAPIPEVAEDGLGVPSETKKKGRSKCTPDKLAEVLLKGERHFARDLAEHLYAYEDGTYKDGNLIVRQAVQSLLERTGNAQHWTSNRGLEVVKYLTLKAQLLWERPPCDEICVLNGILNVSTGALRPHSPDFLSQVQIPVHYDPAATCPRWEQFVHEVFPTDAVEVAWEILGDLVTPDRSIQKAILLTGAGGNGKSVFLNACQRFIGKRNCSALSLHDLEGNRFALAGLYGKLVNICADLPAGVLSSTSVFKALTSGDALTAERKYEPGFTFQPHTRLVFSANHPPRSRDASKAFFDRWLTLPFTRNFRDVPGVQKPQGRLLEELSAPEELSGVMNHALAGLRRLRATGRFTESPSMKAAVMEFRSATDPLEVWLQTHTVERPDASVAALDLLTQFNSDCARHGRTFMTQTAFGAAVRRLRPRMEVRARGARGEQREFYVGIGLLAEPDRSQRGAS